jgi:hypothetical protein
LGFDCVVFYDVRCGGLGNIHCTMSGLRSWLSLTSQPAAARPRPLHKRQPGSDATRHVAPLHPLPQHERSIAIETLIVARANAHPNGQAGVTEQVRTDLALLIGRNVDAFGSARE